MTRPAVRDRELSNYRLDKNIVSSTKQRATSPYPEKNQFAIDILIFFLKLTTQQVEFDCFSILSTIKNLGKEHKTFTSISPTLPLDEFEAVKQPVTVLLSLEFGIWYISFLRTSKTPVSIKINGRIFLPKR